MTGARKPVTSRRRCVAVAAVSAPVASVLALAVCQAFFPSKLDALRDRLPRWVEERSPALDRIGLVLGAVSCRAGDGRSCNYLGRIMDEGWGGVTKNPARAAQYYGQACAAGSGVGCSNLGVSHQVGDGVTLSPRRAAALYERACAAHAAVGCKNLGSLYEEGVGVPKDRELARRLYRAACDGGEAKACAKLTVL
jgi:TPR repeat protein